MPYQAFVALMSEVLPQDRDISTFYFVMHLSYHLVFQFRWSFNFFRQYISEKFSTEAVSNLIVCVICNKSFALFGRDAEVSLCAFATVGN